LARVSQLGLVSYVYPAARHTRLDHSLGTYSYACRYLQHLWGQREEPLFRCLMTSDHVIAASLWALFHDLGQYPHCHDIEDAVPSLKRHSDRALEIYRTRTRVGSRT